MIQPVNGHSDLPKRTPVWGLPLAPLRAGEALDACLRIIESGTPEYVITANLNYAMICSQEDLHSINRDAAMILADGMPLVWASKFAARRLPERITGADHLIALCAEGARRGYRIYILGGPPGQGEQAGRQLAERYPGLVFAGSECPPFRAWTAEEEAQMLERIRQARPHLLFVAFGQPKGERWIHRHYRTLGVPLSIQIGGSFDFVTGRLQRAPRWMQVTGLEWVYRLWQEPRRLGSRYAANAWFLARVTLGTLFSRRNNRLARGGARWSRGVTGA